MEKYLWLAAASRLESGRGGMFGNLAQKASRLSIWAIMALLICLTSGTMAQAKHAPNLKFKSLDGQTVRLDSLRGSIAVVNFWATWCLPCRAELPRLAALREKYRKQGVRFIAISVDEPKDFAKIPALLKSQKVVIPVWVGADLGTLGRLGFGNVVPATLILDAQGNIIGRIEGEAQVPDVQGYLDWLLHDRQGNAPPKRIKRY